MSEIPFPAGIFIYIGNRMVTGIPVFTAFMALGFMAALFFTRYDSKNKMLDEHHVQNAVLLAFFFGLLGARFFILFEQWHKIWVPGTNLISGLYYLLFFKHGLNELYPQQKLLGVYDVLLSNSGFVFFGGLIFGFIAIYLYFKINKISIAPYLDTFALAIALSYPIGRIGCMISGDGCFGQSCPIDFFPISVIYGPENGICNTDPAFQSQNPLYCTYGTAVWNTPLIEASVSFATFGILFFKAQNHLPNMMISAIVLMQNSITRFFVEFIRLNDAVWPILKPPVIYIENQEIELIHLTKIIHGMDKNLLASFYRHWYWYGFTSAQIISIFLFFIGMTLWIYIYKKHAGKKQ